MNFPLVQIGIANGTPVVAKLQAGYAFEALRRVTLTQTYVRSPPPDWPRADAGATVNTSKLAFPQTISNGAVLQVFPCEADALIAASAAVAS